MLIKCPECDLQVSTKATTCPHCGYPLASKVTNVRKPTKRRRLPNGFGRITEIKNANLRKPYRAMVTTGKSSTGIPTGKIIGFYESYNDAYTALVEYNKNPYDLDTAMTVKDLYEKWSEKYFAGLKSTSSSRTIKAAWKYCSSVYDMKAADIRTRHIKGCMDEATTANNKMRIKSMWNLMLDYALEYEIVERNYARTFEISKDIIQDRDDAKKGHMSFTDDEMNTLWKNLDVPYVNIILLQCYSGWRPQELGQIELKNVNINEWWFIGGMKTDAGINRKVPIHPAVREIVKDLYEESTRLGSEYLITCTDMTTHRSNPVLTYDKYNKRFSAVRDDLGLRKDHRPHDCRKQFITMCKKYNVDEYAIKKLVGHAVSDITEKLYTDRDFSWLETEIAKIKGPEEKEKRLV